MMQRPRPRTSSGDGTCPARRPEGMRTTTTGRRATPVMRCPRLPNAHLSLDRRGAPRSPGRTRQHGVCCHWGPRQGPRQPLATYALSARTYYGLRSRASLSAVHASHVDAVRRPKAVTQCGLPRRDDVAASLRGVPRDSGTRYMT